MRRSHGTLACALALLGLGFAWLDAGAFVPITSSSGRSAAWSSSDLPIAVAINVNSSGVDPNLTADAIRNGFAEWEGAGSRAAFVEVTDPAQRARTDWQSLDSRLVLFDPNGSSGLFGGSPSGTIAVTPILVASGGRIVDADVVFNARDFSFSVAATPGTMDIENIGTHELGHLLGLDHTGFIGATMFPFADFQETLRRTIEKDDRAGVVAAYGSSTPLSSGGISGRVVRGAGTPIRGAHVVLLDDVGAGVSSTLTNASGLYAFRNLADGSYRVYVDPLDGPVDAGNLLLDAADVQTDFSTTFFGGNASPQTVAVQNGGTTSLVDLVADPELSTFDADPTTPRVLQVFPGRSGSIRVFGNDTASATPRVVAPALSVSSMVVAPGTLRVDVDVASGAREGLYDLFLEHPATSRWTALTGVIDVGAGPRIDAVFPPAGSVNGGTLVEVRGANLRAGSTVRLGGVPLVNPTVHDSTRMTFTTSASIAGARDLEVDDPQGGVFVLPGAYTFVNALDPTLVAVDPAIGDPAGGEEVLVHGTNFANGATVRFGADPLRGVAGAPATNVAFLDAQTLRVETPANTGIGLGRTNVLVENPDRTSALAELFAYSQVIASGTRFTGRIAESGEVDQLRMDVLLGTAITASLKADRDATLVPVLEITDALGNLLLSSDEGDPAFDPAFATTRNGRVQIKRWPAPSTESIGWRIRGAGLGTGAYALAVKAKLPRAARSVRIASGTLDPGNPIEIDFEALGGTSLTGKVQFEKEAGLALTITLDGPKGAVVLVPGVTPGVFADDVRLTFRGFVLDAFGAHRLTIATAAGQSGVRAALKFEEPRVRQTLQE